jgi:hypothetical protein
MTWSAPVALATPGGLTFTTTQLTTALSNPTQGTHWFSFGVVNQATTALGDYSSITPAPTCGVVAFWTDLRNNVCFGVRCGTAEDISSPDSLLGGGYVIDHD